MILRYAFESFLISLTSLTRSSSVVGTSVPAVPQNGIRFHLRVSGQICQKAPALNENEFMRQSRTDSNFSATERGSGVCRRPAVAKEVRPRCLTRCDRQPLRAARLQPTIAAPSKIKTISDILFAKHEGEEEEEEDKSKIGAGDTSVDN